MSIPLDRLYHYIESIAKDIHSDDVIIYRFYPHGSKKFEDLNNIVPVDNPLIIPQVFCNDQEPLNFNLYQNSIEIPVPDEVLGELKPLFKTNLRKYPTNIYDSCILIHSEQRSKNVEIYNQHNFIPVYYWCHALLARDWYRYAQHIDLPMSNDNTKFLIYNRAWSGTREYRLKFAELLVKNNLLENCNTSVGFVDNNIHYTEHQFENPIWKPSLNLETYFNNNSSTACYSADFNINDYRASTVEVVLETLFDDTRWHLTEKILRPIALGRPFLLCGTPGSLQYLKSYGFKTFDSVFNENYDQIDNPYQRMESVISTMKKIAAWSTAEKNKKCQELQEIANYNKQRFFSQDFFDQVDQELKTNLCNGIESLVSNNTFNRYFNLIEQFNTNSTYLSWRKENLPKDRLKMFNDAYHVALSKKVNKY